MKSIYKALFSAFLAIFFSNVQSQTADFESRRQAYLAAGLAGDSTAITVQAYLGQAVNMNEVNHLLSGISSNENIDFFLVKLIRVLYLTNGEYDSAILPVINSIPYWLHDGETTRQYWSENHMCMWMSSDWLMHEKYGKPIDDRLYGRLKHFLELKIQYGFYEFYSSTYLPYCLSGLLNLSDYAQDSTLKSLSGQAAKRLLSEILMLTNDQGVYFPAAGRNYYGKYKSAWGQNHSHLIYLLTGMGPIPDGVSHSGGFLATSSLVVDEVIQSWTPQLDVVNSIGHTLQDGIGINSVLSFADRVMFQWSSGAYFHPDIAIETATLVNDSNLWGHTEFLPFAQFQDLPVEQAPFLANIASSISKSSVICGQDVAVFKHGSITLSSVQDFWKGKQGYQVMPCVANIGRSAVLTASGKVEADWEDRMDRTSNNDLPYVEQKHNVALLMYRPETQGLAAFNDTNPEVSVFWPSAELDEERQDSLWILGRQDGNYVAVRRGCYGETLGISTCFNPDAQTWVIVVGDSAMYGSFDQFENLVQQSLVNESWYYDPVDSQWVYSASVQFDTTSISYDWRGDYGPLLGVNWKGEDRKWQVFPNPGTEELHMKLPEHSEVLTVRVSDALGRVLFQEQILQHQRNVNIPASSWPEASYFITLSGAGESLVKKWVKVNP